MSDQKADAAQVAANGMDTSADGAGVKRKREDEGSPEPELPLKKVKVEGGDSTAAAPAPADAAAAAEVKTPASAANASSSSSSSSSGSSLAPPASASGAPSPQRPPALSRIPKKTTATGAAPAGAAAPAKKGLIAASSSAARAANAAAPKAPGAAATPVKQPAGGAAKAPASATPKAKVLSVKKEEGPSPADVAGIKVKKEEGAEVKVKKEDAAASVAGIKVKKEESSDSDEDDDKPLGQRFKNVAKTPAKPVAVKEEKKTASATPAKRLVKQSDRVKKEEEEEESESSSESSSDSSSESDSDESSSSDSSDDDSSDSSSGSDDEEDDSDESDEDEEKPRRSRRSRSSTKEIKMNDSSKYQTREVEPLKPTQGANKWWNRPFNKKIKWTTLEHNGVLFPPPYEPHGVKMLYDGQPVELPPDAEEIATMYASMMETDYVRKDRFNANFFKCFLKALPADHPIKDFTKCDFRPIWEFVKKRAEEKKLERKKPEVKKQLKEEKERLQQVYGYALVDGYLEKVGNYRVEPPGLFRGRGDHPKSGLLKKRIQPEDVVINIGHDVPIPKPPPGHSWKGVVHDNTVTWLACWQDSISGHMKYVFLAANSRFKGFADMQKYKKAQELKKYIDKIRKNYNEELTGKTLTERQRATAIYLIDKLALRVGGEKDPDEEADTVGCCSLRVEHLEFKDNNTVTFDFLGKDSMRYYNTVTLDPRAYKNLKEFCKGKKPGEQVFDTLTTQKLNDHLKSLMPGLSAKVFRTYNASITLQNELRNPSDQKTITPQDTINAKILYYNRANRMVAILCNHQRSIPKGHETQMEKLNQQKANVEKELEEVKAHLEWVKKGKKGKAPPNSFSDKPRTDSVERLEKKVETLEKRLENLYTKLTLKDEGKTIALSTSRINYMDPRITVAWCKRMEVPLEKIFAKSLLAKFPWAMEVPSTWEF